ncbi:MAG: GNAT family N-acetyltransferase [Cyanobacteria bacterium SZAS TMP-1]|nr:GNAT family N-acetyltransferase [Cyanobacteria bacterium SZAS TMP-1]
MADCTIRKLGQEDFDLYWPVRLLALQESPEAFGASYEESKIMPREEAARRLSPADGGFVLGAFCDLDGSGEQLVGTLGLLRGSGLKVRHKAMIWGVYVVPAARGRSLSRALMLAALERCRSMDGLEELNLTVVVGNRPARRLYLSLGFETYGLEKRALKIADTYFDEELMTLSLLA